MTNKKAPLAWWRWGRAKIDDGGRPHSAETARESQQQFCRDCSFYRAIDLPSGRVRRLCALTGIKNPVTPCPHFRPAEGETAWSALDEPRQAFVCRACAHGIVPHIRAALLGLVGCMAGRVPDGSAYPVHCRDFRARGTRHAA